MDNFHPIAGIFPMMPEADLAKLAEDIRENGLREPIWTDQGGRIIDGRNRFLACQQAGVEPAYRPYEGDEAGLPAFVISLNLHRRHLNESQRSMIAARLADIERGEAGRNRSANSQTKTTAPCAAKMLNVGERGVYHAKTVLQDGTPEEIEAVEAGEAAVSTVAKTVRERKKVEAVPTPKPIAANHGPRVSVPEGMSLEEWTREIMRCVAKGQTAEEAAADAHMAVRLFRNARDIVVLADRGDLSPADTATVKAALDGMNSTQQVTPFYESVRPIVERIWGQKPGTSRDKAEHRRREDFERGLGALTTACAYAEKMEVPHLPEERRAEVIAELREAEKHISNLRKRIEA